MSESNSKVSLLVTLFASSRGGKLVTLAELAYSLGLPAAGGMFITLGAESESDSGGESSDDVDSSS